MGVPSGASSLPQMGYRDLEDTVTGSCFENSGLDIPVSFIDSLRSVLVVSEEYNIH